MSHTNALVSKTVPVERTETILSTVLPHTSPVTSGIQAIVWKPVQRGFIVQVNLNMYAWPYTVKSGYS